MKRKNAFTIMELVFVIVVIGILSAVAMPRLYKNDLHNAATQLVSHIRYTQHLAMQDNKFNPSEEKWFLRRWALRFQENVVFNGIAHNNIWTYTVFSDLPNFNQHNPDLNGMARNSLNKNQYLSGGYDNVLDVLDEKSMKELQLNKTYNIEDVSFGNGCRSTTLYLSFDYIGRPFNSYPNDYPYQLATPGWHRLLEKPCHIELCLSDCATASDSEKITIVIEPETGYTHILKN